MGSSIVYFGILGQAIARSWLALELTGTGIRVVCLRTAANPDTRTIQDTAGTIGTLIDVGDDYVVIEFEDGQELTVPCPHFPRLPYKPVATGAASRS